MAADAKQDRQVLSNIQIKESGGRRLGLQEHLRPLRSLLCSISGVRPGHVKSQSSANHVHKSKQLSSIYILFSYTELEVWPTAQPHGHTEGLWAISCMLFLAFTDKMFFLFYIKIE